MGTEQTSIQTFAAVNREACLASMGTSTSKKNIAVAGLAPIIILLITAAISPATPSSLVEATPSYQPHVPIFIDGDASFTPTNGVTGGDGTASNPYRIEGWEINANSQDGVFIRNTRAYFLVRNVYIHSAIQNHNGTVLVNVSNGRLANSTISNNRYGIRLASASNTVITGNNVSANEIGMFLSGFNTVVTDNVVWNNVDGLRLGAAFNGLVSNNQFFSNSHYGINLDYSYNITVNRNTFTGNGVSIYGNSLFYLNTHTITLDNLVNGKPILYYKDCSGVTADGVVVGQLIFVNCNNIKVANLQINSTDIGLQLLNVHNATIVSNQISRTKVDGIRVQSSTNITISGNTVVENGMYSLDIFSASNMTVTRNLFNLNSFGGLFLFNAQNITLTYNTLSSNTWYGASLNGSTGIRAHQNNFQNNRYQASDNRAGENTWDNGYPSGGNHWSDYTGTDDNGDGIGDTPYIIDIDSRDNYPLMQQAKNHDVAVTDVVVAPSFAFQGQIISIYVTVSNLGETTESFALTIYANETALGSQTAQDLIPGGTRTTVFTWNTAGVISGKYTIQAIAGPVAGETKTQDNTMTREVTISGAFPFLSLAHREAADGSLVDISLTFPDTCYETTSWGTPERNGDSFRVQLSIRDLHNDTINCIPAETRGNYTYALGHFENGTFSFTATICLQHQDNPESYCGPERTISFAVPNSPTVLPFWQQYWQPLLAAAFGAILLSAGLLSGMLRKNARKTRLVEK